MDAIEKLLAGNRAWAKQRVAEDPQYFRHLAELQRPEYLWIGCSDSRVAANVITGTQPGEVFVQRNIANLVVDTDLNLFSVLEYAVKVLEVRHVIVCGHYGCGGVKAAMTRESLGLIDKWLYSIKDVYRLHRAELDDLAGEARVDRLVELNVREQVVNLTKTAIIQSAWKHHRRPHLHGWVYGLTDGLMKPLVTLPPGSPVDEVFAYDNV
ncbi:MAG: carbonate dehydratase [Myxococcales bacterium]|nr:carbonate dehydratase [Myxococcales bacterium]